MRQESEDEGDAMKAELASICVSDREFYVTAVCFARTGDQTHHLALFFLGVVESRIYVDCLFVVGMIRWMSRIWRRALKRHKRHAVRESWAQFAPSRRGTS